MYNNTKLISFVHDRIDKEYVLLLNNQVSYCTKNLKRKKNKGKS